MFWSQKNSNKTVVLDHSSCPVLRRPGVRDAYYGVPGDDLMRRMIHIPEVQMEKLRVIHENMMRDSSRVLTIFTLGGSMTGGSECAQGKLRMKQCAWPNRVSFHLERYFGEDRVRVFNLARGGTQTEVAVGSLYSILTGHSYKPDLILTDFSVNDAVGFDGTNGRQSAVAARYRGDMYEKGLALAERLVEGIQDIFPGVLHMMIFSFCRQCGIDAPQLNGMRDVAIHSKTGVIDTRHLLRESSRFPWFPGSHHPDFRSHQILADVVGYAVLNVCFRPDCIQKTMAVSSYSIAKPEIKSKLLSCTKPKSHYDAHTLYGNPEMMKGVTYTGDWALKEDVTGKPGFISNTPLSQILFEVEFGAVPSLTVMYLRSYEHMGNFKLSLNGKSITLHGLWGQPFSTVQVFWSQAYAVVVQKGASDIGNNANDFGIVGFGVRPGSRHNISFINEGSGNHTKSKIVSVLTC